MEEQASKQERPLKEVIGAWLASTQGEQVPLGLPADIARARASELLTAILGGSLNPASLRVTEDLRDILSVLIGSLTDLDQEPAEVVSTANAVYQFIAALEWPATGCNEKQDLLRECAETGWGGMGLSLEAATAWRCSESPLAGETPKYHNARLTPQEARTVAQEYLDTLPGNRSAVLRSSVLSDPDALVALTEMLRQRIDSLPTCVADVAAEIYDWLRNDAEKVGLFDERDFFKGEAALLAGTACRHLGKRSEALRWFDRAEVSYRSVVNPAPGLSRVAYARLSLRFEMTEYDYVLEFIPSVKVAFEHAGMVEDALKCCLLEAMALKQSGRRQEALSLLTQVDVAAPRGELSTLPARIVAEIGDLHQLNGEAQKAMAAFSKAVALLGSTDVCLTRADLKMFVGAAHWGEGQLTPALDAFRSSLADYDQLGMTPRVAYMRLYIADTLLRLDRAREAEWEILAALPTIEEQKMVPEGFAAVVLLKESVRRRKTDPNALRELREHLEASK